MASETNEATPQNRPRLHRFTVREYHAMGRAGVLAPDVRTELIHGRILTLSPIGSRHAWLVARVSRHFSQHLPAENAVWTQSPLALVPRSEPEPDVMLLRAGASPRRLPRVEDVLLVVEVSDATYGYDRDVKLPLYARAGVPEVWLVVPERRTVEVYCRPESGVYSASETRGADAQIAPLLLPGTAPLDLATLFADL